MSEEVSAEKAFERLVSLYSGIKPGIGQVKRGTVDEQKGICEIIVAGSGQRIPRAFLNVIANPAVIVVPADESYVAYLHTRNFANQAHIVACSKIRKIILKTAPAGTVTLELSDAGVELKAGSNGRVKIAAAGTEIGSGAQKMVRGDELKAWADQLVTSLQTIVTWGAGVTPPLAGVVIPAFPGTVLSSKNKVE